MAAAAMAGVGSARTVTASPAIPGSTWKTGRKLPVLKAKAAPRRAVRPGHIVASMPQEPERAEAAGQDAGDKVADLITRERRSMSSRRRLLSGAALAAASVVVPCSCCGVRPAIASEGGGNWSYVGNNGPTRWAGACAKGKAQSPVNVNFMSLKAGRLGPLEFNYKPMPATVQNNGVGSMQVNFPKGCQLYINGRVLNLLQYHFHTPSEHAMEGRFTAIEAHLVHKDAETGRLGVVGIFMEPSSTVTANPCLEAALNFVPTVPRTQEPVKGKCVASQGVCTEGRVDPRALLPKEVLFGSKRAYIHYAGSLTTPPCSEGVDWFVVTVPMKVPDAQVLAFSRFVGFERTYGQNSRPLQPLNGRELEFFSL